MLITAMSRPRTYSLRLDRPGCLQHHCCSDIARPRSTRVSAACSGCHVLGGPLFFARPTCISRTCQLAWGFTYGCVYQERRFFKGSWRYVKVLRRCQVRINFPPIFSGFVKAFVTGKIWWHCLSEEAFSTSFCMLFLRRTLQKQSEGAYALDTPWPKL